MVTWIPYSRTDIPPGWRRLWLTDHFQETSINHLDENYRAKWNDRAKRALKKYEKSGAKVLDEWRVAQMDEAAINYFVDNKLK